MELNDIIIIIVEGKVVINKVICKIVRFNIGIVVETVLDIIKVIFIDIFISRYSCSCSFCFRYIC